MALIVCSHCAPADAVPASQAYRGAPVCELHAWRLAQLALICNEVVSTLADVLQVGACVVILAATPFYGTRGKVVGRIDADTLTVVINPPVFATITVNARYVARAECVPAPVVPSGVREPMWR